MKHCSVAKWIFHGKPCRHLCLLPCLTSDDLRSFSVTPSCARSAFNLLKPHRADGTSLRSDHLVFVLPTIKGFIANLFTSILRHGYMPAAVHDCSLVLIYKDNKDPTSSDNYHPLTPSLSKASEWSILLMYLNQSTNSDLQFGFKKGLYTSLCTDFIKSVASKFVHNSSTVFGCFLDASEAFDNVNLDILFTKFVERGVPPILNRFLLSW